MMERLEMIEGVYKITPQEIIQAVEVDFLEGNLNAMDRSVQERLEKIESQ